MSKKAFGTYEIAGICNVSPTTVGNWVDKGLLPTFTTGGGHRRVWNNDLWVFLKKHNIPVPKELMESRTLQVLIVDDEAAVRAVIRRTLAKLYPGIEAHEAIDGFEAGQKVSELALSLIILDLRLPGMDGLKVCGMIRSNSKLNKIKILAISGHNPDESAKQSLNAGADDFLRKPFNADELKETISRILGDRL